MKQVKSFRIYVTEERPEIIRNQRILFFVTFIPAIIGAVFQPENGSAFLIIILILIFCLLLLNNIYSRMVKSYRVSGVILLSFDEIEIESITSISLYQIQEIVFEFNGIKGDLSSGAAFGIELFVPQDGSDNKLVIITRDNDILKYSVLLKSEDELNKLKFMLSYYSGKGIQTKFYKE